MIECVVALLIVSGVLVAAMNAVVSTSLTRRAARDRAYAASLAEDLLVEALSKKYENPTAGSIIGIDNEDTVFLPRAMDDVDDYEGLLENPPFSPDGATVPGAEGWKRLTRVEYVSPTNPSQTVGSDQGVKRVTVTVSKGDKVVLTLVGLRTRAWDKARS